MMTGPASILPLRADGLGFSANGRVLLAGVSFTLPAGGITAVVGPNGTGKSLLLRLCHGLLVPGAGRVEWARDSAGRKRHTMVFQRPVMLRRSAKANLEHALAAAGWASMERRERVLAALARFGLEALADSPARLLSGGEQQRLAIARAWALAPEVIFLDEPTSHLDPGATRQIETMLFMLASEGATLVMATHDLGQARRLAARVLFLNRGRIVEDAPAARFFESPATAEAKAFLAGDLLW